MNFVRCDTSQHTTVQYNTLQHALQHNAAHRNTPQHPATLCNTLNHTLQYKATHRNISQHIATHRNTLKRNVPCASLALCYVAKQICQIFHIFLFYSLSCIEAANLNTHTLTHTHTHSYVRARAHTHTHTHAHICTLCHSLKIERLSLSQNCKESWLGIALPRETPPSQLWQGTHSRGGVPSSLPLPATLGWHTQISHTLLLLLSVL